MLINSYTKQSCGLVTVIKPADVDRYVIKKNLKVSESTKKYVYVFRLKSTLNRQEKTDNFKPLGTKSNKNKKIKK